MQAWTRSRIVIWVASAAIALLAWAAFDDITTGTEPDHTLEWLMVAIALIWFTAVGVLRYRLRRTGN